jgi:purine-binding chemotaxis protein CheW
MSEQMREQVERAASGGSQQYLTFTLGQEEYGVEILKIQEIKGYSAVTPLPNAPTFDLRKKFNLPEAEYTPFTVIVVVQVQGKTLGFVVDAVSDVLTVAGEAIRPTPDLHGQLDTRFLTGLAPTGEEGQKLVILLDIDKVLTASEAATAASAAVEAAMVN